MRWIDIILPEPGINQNLDTLCEEAAAVAATIPAIQERDGLDAVTVAQAMGEAGRLLFRAVTGTDPMAFAAGAEGRGSETPDLDDPEHDGLTGFHIVAGGRWLDLPWSWLHNGVAFLLATHPIAAGPRPSGLPAEQARRPWMQRQFRAAYLVGDDGTCALPSVLPLLRPADALPPELLFIPGHSDPQRRRLIYREAEAITTALDQPGTTPSMLSLEVPSAAVTPSALCEQGMTYQALHFAGPTSQPVRTEDSSGEAWMNELISETAVPDDADFASAMGLEGEVLGVDPITSLLDDVVENYESKGRQPELTPLVSRQFGRGGAGSGGASSTWMLEDGPVAPESLGRSGQLPPFVFSNSYRALPELGARFTAAGASTFIGPVAPLFSRPARLFAGHFYGAMGRGWCAGGALWRAARACREELGDEHPAWLSYGLQGYGSLSLQYL
jgi:hypothetical protein